MIKSICNFYFGTEIISLTKSIHFSIEIVFFNRNFMLKPRIEANSLRVEFIATAFDLYIYFIFFIA